MLIVVKPYRENRVLYYTLTSPLDFKELQQVVDSSRKTFLDEADKPIHAIVDLSAVHDVHRQHFSESMRLIRNRHPMDGHTVLLVRSAFIERMANVILNVAEHVPLLMVRSEQEAWQAVDALLAEETSKV